MYILLLHHLINRLKSLQSVRLCRVFACQCCSASPTWMYTVPSRRCFVGSTDGTRHMTRWVRPRPGTWSEGRPWASGQWRRSSDSRPGAPCDRDGLPGGRDGLPGGREYTTRQHTADKRRRRQEVLPK